MSKRQRTIVFVGNCQSQVLATLYGKRIAPLLGEAVISLAITPGMAEQPPASFVAKLEQADVVVRQKTDSTYPLPDAAFAGRKVEQVWFPYVSGRAYWPYGGTLHIHHTPAKGSQPAFPYEAELGDALLNRMIQENVPPDEALRRYDETIARSHGRIRRLAELHLERQADRDAACGMRFADFIAANYQREAMFVTQGHPTLPLARMLIEQVFLALGVPYSLVEAAIRSLRVSPFPRHGLPIHPGVAEALGLAFVAPGQRYLFHSEGSFTFEEYARRYLADVWEPDVWRGLALFRSGDHEAAARHLQSALQRCAGTGAVWRTLAVSLARLGREAAADEAMATAIERDPNDPDSFAAHAEMLARRGQFAAAEAAARRAVDLFPISPVGHRALAEVMARQQRLTEAVAVARLAQAADPADARGMAGLAHHLQRAGELAEAEWLLRRALEMEPGSAPMQRQHDEVKARIERAGKAKAA